MDNWFHKSVIHTKQAVWTALAPIAVEILLCRGSAQKIGTDSGKKLQKNNIKTKKILNTIVDANHPN